MINEQTVKLKVASTSVEYARWGEITGNIESQTDLMNLLGERDLEEVQETITQGLSDIDTAKEEAIEEIRQSGSGQPVPVTLASEMTDQSTIYLYLGSEEGYDYGYIYAYINNAWVKTFLYGKGEDGVSSGIIDLDKYGITSVDYRGQTITAEMYDVAYANNVGFQNAINDAKANGVNTIVIPSGTYPVCYYGEEDQINTIINITGVNVIAYDVVLYVIFDDEGLNPYYTPFEEGLEYQLMGIVVSTDSDLYGVEIIGERGYRHQEWSNYRDKSKGIQIKKNSYCNTIKDCKVHHVSGDGIGSGMSLDNVYVSSTVTCTAQKMVNGVVSDSTTAYLSPRLGIGWNVDSSKPLHIAGSGYNYFIWTAEPLKIHCFTQEEAYLGTVLVEQGNPFNAPPNTFYVYVEMVYGSEHALDSTTSVQFRFGNAVYYGTKIIGCESYLNQRGGMSNLPSETVLEKCIIHDNGGAYGDMPAYYDGTQFGIDIEDWYIHRITIDSCLFYGQLNDVLFRCNSIVIKNSTFADLCRSLNYQVDAELDHSMFIGNFVLTSPASFGKKTAVGCTFKGSVSSAIVIIDESAQDGLPSGGSAGQFLVKSSGTDYDATWVSLSTWQGGSY